MGKKKACSTECIQKINGILGRISQCEPLVNLMIRWYVAMDFWKSAVFKLPQGFLGVGKGNWENTLYLYTQEHPVPILSPEIAAYVGTFFEVVCPLLLFIGLGSRISAFILLVMALFIELSYQ